MGRVDGVLDAGRHLGEGLQSRIGTDRDKSGGTAVGRRPHSGKSEEPTRSRVLPSLPPLLPFPLPGGPWMPVSAPGKSTTSLDSFRWDTAPTDPEGGPLERQDTHRGPSTGRSRGRRTTFLWAQTETRQDAGRQGERLSAGPRANFKARGGRLLATTLRIKWIEHNRKKIHSNCHFNGSYFA